MKGTTMQESTEKETIAQKSAVQKTTTQKVVQETNNRTKVSLLPHLNSLFLTTYLK